MTAPAARRAGAGFTLIEAMLALAVLSILLMLGVPSMKSWLNATKAVNATGFYSEGFSTARNQAMSNNSLSRLVFSNNANGQPEWRVDICFRTSDNLCENNGTGWSTATAAAKDAPAGAAAYRSIRRNGATLPPSTQMKVTLAPEGSSAVYFTPLGWVDTSRSPRVNRIDLTPTTLTKGDFMASAVLLTLTGSVIKCNPDAAVDDSRRCPQ